jgi:hypothetical protein
MRYIREGRFGPPKTQKTRMVVGTYPRPLLVLEYDLDGMSVSLDPYFKGQPQQLTVDEVVTIAAGKTPPPEIGYVDLAAMNTMPLDELYIPRKDGTTFPATIKLVNTIVKANPCPWQTVVVDTVTGLSDCIYGHQALVNTAALADARKWAGNIGMKVGQVIGVMAMAKCHVVFIFHDETDKNEITSEVRTFPMVYSKIRESLGAMFNQFFYTKVDNQNKPRLETKPIGLKKGIGARWPGNLAPEIDADFKSIYGEALKQSN